MPKRQPRKGTLRGHERARLFKEIAASQAARPEPPPSVSQTCICGVRRCLFTATHQAEAEERDRK